MNDPRKIFTCIKCGMSVQDTPEQMPYGKETPCFRCLDIERDKKQSIKDHLEFIYYRLINVHSENPNTDYMLRLEKIFKLEVM